jgi:hypothetical protein
MEDLEEAIVLYRGAVSLHSPGHPAQSGSLHLLALSISTRFEQLGRMEDLEESVVLYFDAQASLPTTHPLHATIQSRLASHILALCHHTPGSDHTVQISDAFDRFQSAVLHSTACARDQFLAALRWAILARQFRHSSVIHAYSTALACLDRHVTVTPTVQSWHKSLAVIPGSLASDAASSAIEEDDLETAVELLEQGRAILWSKMQGFRSPLDKLRKIDGDLADEFQDVSRELEHHAMSIDIEPLPPGFYDRQTKKHRILSERWDQVVQRIRDTEGFADFLQPVSFAALQSAAAEGPVIIVNISSYRSDAIILRSSDPPVLVHPPDATPKALQGLSKDLSSALDPDHDAGKGMPPILRQLWDLVVSPVVGQLTEMCVAENSRVWWCPTAQLCALPLHAALVQRPTSSSTAPSVSASAVVRRPPFFIRPSVCHPPFVILHPSSTHRRVIVRSYSDCQHRLQLERSRAVSQRSRSAT